MDFGLKDRVAIVAASSEGLGKAVAMELAREGAKIVICSRNEKILKQTAENIESETESNVLAIPTNLTDYSQVKKLIKTTIEKFSKIDILITNCGGPPSGSFEDFSIEDWQKAIELNLMSTIYLCKETLPFMVNQNAGKIIMITSISAKQPINGLILSNVSRAGVTALAKSLSNEYGKNNILVNTVCPGYTKTERVTELADTIAKRTGTSVKEVIKSWENLNALGKLATPEEFAQAVAFLASEKANHITGVSLQIDGGHIKSLF